MGLFNRSLLDQRWDDPALGVTEADFLRWPGKSKPKRDKVVPKIDLAIAAGEVKLPVTLVGKCTSYDAINGHNSHGAAIHEDTDFIVSRGRFGTTITLFRPRARPIRDFDLNETLIEKVNSPHGGYVDLQFLSTNGTPCGRIGFIYSHGGEDNARSRAHLVALALKAASELPSV